MIELDIKIDIKYPELHNLYKERKNLEGDLGFDLYCPEEITIFSGQPTTIDLGVVIQATKYIYGERPEVNGVSYFLLPRSSFTKYNLVLLNSVGVIDKDYRGNLKTIVTLIGSKPSSYVTIEKGTRLFQIVFPEFNYVGSYKIANELSKTERGEGGFGSTGR